MTERDHVAQVESILVRDRCELGRCRRDIFRCARPSAARISDAPVLDIPGRDARLPQRFTKMAHVGEREPSPPKAAMDDNRDRPVFRNGGNAQIAKLLRLGAVGYAPIGVRRFAIENIAAHVAMVDPSLMRWEKLTY